MSLQKEQYSSAISALSQTRDPNLFLQLRPKIEAYAKLGLETNILDHELRGKYNRTEKVDDLKELNGLKYRATEAEN